MNRGQAAVALAAPPTWMALGLVAARVGLLHVSLMPAWLVEGMLLWGPFEVSLLVVILDEQRPRRLSWWAFAEATTLWVLWSVSTGWRWL